MIRLIESEHEIGLDTTDRSYIALSHCWGLIPIIRTLKENYKEHCKTIAPESLSKTFREAIHTTRKLGYRYIWIDSLCIIQDDDDDWVKEAATMSDVYQCAVLTIAAAHASGGDVGCFAERDGLLYLPFYIEFPQTTVSKSPIRVQFTTFGRVKALGGGDLVLLSRAWVLQEQILSPRVLMFDESYISWECLTMHGSEKSPTSGTTKYDHHHKCIRESIMDASDFFDRPEDSDCSLIDEYFWSKIQHANWCAIVMDYTHRGMTKPKDRIAALAGIAKALQRHTKGDYWVGLWSRHFALGLMWGISHSQDFRHSSDKASPVDPSIKVRHKDTLAPSWSWASVTVPVIYEGGEMPQYDPICHVIDVEVTGGVDRQSGYAKIRGHVRRGYVNAVYPNSIREAAEEFPHMTGNEYPGRNGQRFTNFKGRLFDATDSFLFSETNPAAHLKDISASHVSREGKFRLIRGIFQPDELINPGTEITFVAITQRHMNPQLKLAAMHAGDASLKVISLALVPSETEPGKYRRVGLAKWEQCTWYGYWCGWKDNRRAYRPSKYWESGFPQDNTWWDWLARKLWWDDLEALGECKQGTHKHGHERGALPEFQTYHPNVNVTEQVLVIV
ncbi:heterokaryon incompatibility protein-domain-containing protein [Phaeosphaeriaceae sp. PMI808]|nr:heterokaryon incompatibility protein-domain-containing protein [Phaeosphaeriaceae sp. PMI808]